MPADVREQLRQLAQAFDEFIDGTGERSTALAASTVGRGGRSRSVPVAAAVLLTAIGCAALWGIVRRHGPSDGPATEVATTTVVAGTADVMPRGALDFATTDRPLPHWPAVSASDPPATTSGYGMDLCDSGPSTRVVRVDSAVAPSHVYSGTLCVFVDLKSARPAATTSCAATSAGTSYARCQRRTELPETAGAATASETVASAESQTANASFPTPTASNQAEIFETDLAVTTHPDSAIDFTDGTITVKVDSAVAKRGGVDQPGACFVIELASGVARGCVGRSLLATGLAYGAFREGEGPVELIGIVPDSVTTVEVGGHAVTPVNNVWHYSVAAASAGRITARAADGRTASTS